MSSIDTIRLIDILIVLTVIASIVVITAWIPQILKGFREKRQELSKFSAAILISTGIILSLYTIVILNDIILIMLNTSLTIEYCILTIQSIIYKEESK